MFLWDYSVVRLKKMHTLGLSQTKYIHTYMFPHTYRDPNRLMWKMKKKYFFISTSETQAFLLFMCH